MTENDSLADEPFSFRETGDGRVQLFQRSRLVVTLKGRAASQFLTRMTRCEGREAQLVMAKATGQFKFGNERAGKKRRL